MGKYPQHPTDYTQSSKNSIGFNSAPRFYSSSSEDAEGGREKGFMRKDNNSVSATFRVRKQSDSWSVIYGELREKV